MGVPNEDPNQGIDAQNEAGPANKEKRKVYPFSMRQIKEQAKKICSKNGGDFKLGMVLRYNFYQCSVT